MIIRYRTVVAGIEVQVRDEDYLESLFKALGAKVISASDKDLEMQFPSAVNARTFKEAAAKRGAIIES